jgi:hypothetical protein
MYETQTLVNQFSIKEITAIDVSLMRRPEQLLEVVLPSSVHSLMNQKMKILEERLKITPFPDAAVLYSKWEVYKAVLTEASRASAWTLLNQVEIFIFLCYLIVLILIF